MKFLHEAAAVALAVALTSGVARADQKLGVDAACYRTTDRIETVTAYYSRRSGFVSVEPNVLRRGQVDVVLHPPRPNPRTGVVSRYAVFCIMQATP